MTVYRRHLGYLLTSSWALFRISFAVSLHHISFQEFCSSHKESKGTCFSSCRKIHERYDVERTRILVKGTSTTLLGSANDKRYCYLFMLIRNFSEKFTHHITDHFQSRLLLLSVTRIIIYDTNFLGCYKSDSSVHFGSQSNICTSSYKNPTKFKNACTRTSCRFAVKI